MSQLVTCSITTLRVDVLKNNMYSCLQLYDYLPKEILISIVNEY